MTKMENYPLRFSAVGPLYPDSMADAKSRFWQTGSPSVSKAEVIRPQPRCATRLPNLLDGRDKFGPKPKGENHGLEILDAILSKDEFEGNPIGFLCGSPPVRSDNPIVHDAAFTKSLGGSPLRASPKVRVEGFVCGSPESHRVIRAQA